MSRVKKYYEFKDYINSKETGNGCKLLSGVNHLVNAASTPTNIKLKLLCGQCEDVFEINMNGFKRKKHKMCNKCSSKQRRKTHSDFVSEVKEVHGGSIIVVGRYKGSETKVRVKHNSNQCEYHEWDVWPTDLQRGSGCPACKFIVQTKTHEEYVQEVIDIHGDNYTFLTEYVNSDTNILVRHESKKCGYHEWSTQTNELLIGTGCPKCARIRSRRCPDEIAQEIFDAVGDEYTILEPFVKHEKIMAFRHNSDFCENHEFEMSAGNFFTGHRCPKCAQLNRRKTHNEFVEDVKNIHGDEYTVLGEYQTSNEKVLMQHNSKDCNYHKWETVANGVMNGNGCPKCRMSKGEASVEEYLQNNNLKYTTQKSFKDCRDIMPLRFDFAIKDKNNNLQCLIEYDGEYHYKLTRHSNAEELLAGQQRRDAIKNKYCKDNNIELIRIPYWELDNIEVVLDRELQGFNI